MRRRLLSRSRIETCNLSSSDAGSRVAAPAPAGCAKLPPSPERFAINAPIATTA